MADQPALVSQAAEQVRKEVEYADRWSTRSRQQLVALAAVSYVQGHVSAPLYGYMNEVLKTPPTGDPNEVLETEAGICGHAYNLFHAVATELGVRVRPVRFYLGNGSRIAAEAWSGGSWHYLDPTWGTVFKRNGRIVSITEARKGSVTRVENSSLLWRQIVADARLEKMVGWSYVLDPKARVAIG